MKLNRERYKWSDNGRRAKQTGYWIVNYSLSLSSYCTPIVANLEIAGLPKKKMDVPVTIVTIERELVNKRHSLNGLSMHVKFPTKRPSALKFGRDTGEDF